VVSLGRIIRMGITKNKIGETEKKSQRYIMVTDTNTDPLQVIST
jgi:hypothetical protein